jgi:hypothetical protein
MKTIRMLRDFDYMPVRKWLMAFKAGSVVSRVPEAAVEAILAAEAGEIVEDVPEEAADAPKPRRRKRKTT